MNTNNFNKFLIHTSCLYTQKIPQPGKNVAAPAPLGVGERDPQPGQQRGVEDHPPALVLARQVHGGHRPYRLAVQDDVLRGNTVPESCLISVSDQGCFE